MKGRWIARLVALLLILGADGLCSSEARAADALLGPEAAKIIPIADGHFHLMGWMDVRELLGYMDRTGIRRAGGAGGLGGGDPAARNAEIGTALGSRYIRSTGQGYWLALKRQGGMPALADAGSPGFQDLLTKVETDLRDRDARVIGEIFVNTLQTPNSPFGQNKMKANAPTLKALLDLAGKYKRPLNLHAQWDRDTAQEFQQLAASNRDARLILAHCGLASTSDVRDLLRQNANVACDLSHRSPPQLKGKAIGQAVFDSRLPGAWKSLIEEFPDRFIVGLDGQENWREYEETVSNIRFGLLANLSPAAAEMVAYKNAETWFGR